MNNNKQLFLALCLLITLMPTHAGTSLSRYLISNSGDHNNVITPPLPESLTLPVKTASELTYLDKLLINSPLRARIECWGMITQSEITDTEKRTLFCIIRNLLFFQHPNNPLLQNLFGQMYDAGCGVEKNNEAAAQWYKLAADQGLAAAQINLGYTYAPGKGIKNRTKQLSICFIGPLNKTMLLQN